MCSSGRYCLRGEAHSCVGQGKALEVTWRLTVTGSLIGTTDSRVSYRTLGYVVSGMAQVEEPRKRYWGSNYTSS